jgi:hypothetical protein
MRIVPTSRSQMPTVFIVRVCNKSRYSSRVVLAYRSPAGVPRLLGDASQLMIGDTTEFYLPRGATRLQLTNFAIFGRKEVQFLLDIRHWDERRLEVDLTGTAIDPRIRVRKPDPDGVN